MSPKNLEAQKTCCHRIRGSSYFDEDWVCCGKNATYVTPLHQQYLCTRHAKQKSWISGNPLPIMPSSPILQPAHHEGHFNTLVRDQDSLVTGFGKHARVMATLPDTGGLYCRVDRKWDLREPTTEEILAVAKEGQGVRGNWKLESRVEYHSNGLDRIDYQFVRAPRESQES